VLESQQTADQPSVQSQLPLTVIEPAVQDDPLRDMLLEIEPDAMSPREALDALYRLKDVDKT